MAILAVSIVVAYIISSQNLNSLLLLLIPFGIIMIYNLFRLIDKTNMEVATFLDNIKYNDYAVSYTERDSISDSFRNLHGAFNLVNKKFRDIRSEKEAQFQYLSAIVENVDTGLICFNEQGKTLLMNKALQQLLHKSYFPNLKSVANYNADMFDALKSINPGEKKLIKFVISGEIVQLSIRKTTLILKDEKLHLYAIHNIHTELEEQEVQSWQKLIRILTHEIMNSITPVVSLSAMIEERLKAPEIMDDDDQTEVQKAVHAINRRSAGLLKFTETYRQLTKIPLPVFQKVNIVELLEDVLILLRTQFESKRIQCVKQFPNKEILCQIDPDLMEQVFLNLLINAIESFDDSTSEPIITVSVFRNAIGEIDVQIADNGSGIEPEILDQIWIPFFTTKDTGSGIGLSLSRQIVQLHKGNAIVQSTVGEGTTFTIRL